MKDSNKSFFKQSGNRSVSGKGRNNGGAFGPSGYCVCHECGEKIPHQRGIKCISIKCPNCGHTMVRDELLQS